MLDTLLAALTPMEEQLVFLGGLGIITGASLWALGVMWRLVREGIDGPGSGFGR